MCLPFHVLSNLFLIQSNLGNGIARRSYYHLLLIHFFQPRKLFPQPTRRILLHLPNHHAHRILLWNHHQHVNMVNLHILLNDLTPLQTPQYFRKKFAQIAPYTRIQGLGLRAQNEKRRRFRITIAHKVAKSSPYLSLRMKTHCLRSMPSYINMNLPFHSST